MPCDLRGYVLRDLVNEVEKRQGKEGLEKLSHIISDINFMPERIYSESECIHLIKAVAITLYGSDSKMALESVGKDIAHVHIKSNMAKIFIGVLGKTLGGMVFNQRFQRLATASQKSVAPSLECSIYQPNDKTVVFAFKNTQMPPEVFLGEYREFFKLMAHDTHAFIRQKPDAVVEIVISGKELELPTDIQKLQSNIPQE